MTTLYRLILLTDSRAEVFDRRLQAGGTLCSSGAHQDGPVGEKLACPDRLTIRFVDRRGERLHHFGTDSVTIAEDGQTLVERNVFEGQVNEIVFRRQ